MTRALCALALLCALQVSALAIDVTVAGASFPGYNYAGSTAKLRLKSERHQLSAQRLPIPELFVGETAGARVPDDAKVLLQPDAYFNLLTFENRIRKQVFQKCGGAVASQSPLIAVPPVVGDQTPPLHIIAPSEVMRQPLDDAKVRINDADIKMMTALILSDGNAALTIQHASGVSQDTLWLLDAAVAKHAVVMRYDIAAPEAEVISPVVGSVAVGVANVFVELARAQEGKGNESVNVNGCVCRMPRQLRVHESGRADRLGEQPAGRILPTPVSAAQPSQVANLIKTFPQGRRFPDFSLKFFRRVDSMMCSHGVNLQSGLRCRSGSFAVDAAFEPFSILSQLQSEVLN